MKPLVTIGIPSFNAATSLRVAIQSALDQTWPNCEIVVVDEGSTDTSLVQASAFGNRVLVITSPRLGVNHTRNMILQEARGEWVQFLDAEDYLEPDKISRQLEEATPDTEADVLFSPVWLETVENSGATRVLSNTSAQSDVCQQWITSSLPGIGGCLWRRTSLLAIGGWRGDITCCQEYELYARSIREGLKWQFTPTPGAVVRAGMPAIQKRDPGLIIRTRTSLLDGLKSWMEKRKTWKAEHQELASRACFHMARHLARYHLREAARYHRDRCQRGLIAVEHSKAPVGYRALYRAFGFQCAERFSALFR